MAALSDSGVLFLACAPWSTRPHTRTHIHIFELADKLWAPIWVGIEWIRAPHPTRAVLIWTMRERQGVEVQFDARAKVPGQDAVGGEKEMRVGNLVGDEGGTAEAIVEHEPRG